MAAAERGAVVAISNSSAAFIMDLYSGCDVRIVKAKRAINSKGSGRGEVDEVLVLIGYSEIRLVPKSIGDSVGTQSLP